MSQSKAFKVYQASAGSGKTYTIVKEYLSLCLKDKASTRNFSRILAITFTNMAAGDMKNKIIDALNSIINSDLDKQPEGLEADLLNELQISRESLKENTTVLFYNILHDYSSFNISTIDSFVQKIARSFSKELRLPSQYSVSTDEDETIAQIVEGIGRQIGNDNPFITKVIEEYFNYRISQEQNVNFERELKEFIKKLFKESAYQKYNQNEFKSLDDYNESLQFLQQKTNLFEVKCRQFVKDFESFLSKFNLSTSDFKYKTSSPCFSLYNSLKRRSYPILGSRQVQLMNDEIIWYDNDTLPKRADFDSINTHFKDNILPFFRYYQTGQASFYFYNNQKKSLSTYALRSIILDEIDQIINDEQVVQLSEFNKRINEIMGDFSVPFVYERIGEIYRHLFIDEFQDTSILQWQNLLPLIDNNLSDQSLNMVVGDGKQSIYRWRSGEIGQIVSLPRIFAKPSDTPAFDDFENTLISNFNFNELKSNYRSFKNIVEFNNEFFLQTSSLLSETNRQVYIGEDTEFNKSVSIRQQVQKKHDGFVQVEIFKNSKDKTVIVNRIPLIIEDLLSKGFQLSDIAILTRTKDEGVLIAKVLSSKGYPIQSFESMLLGKSNRVQLIINTLNYLIHDTNEVAIANVLFYWKATHSDPNDDLLEGLLCHVKDIAQKQFHIENQLGIEPGRLRNLLSQSYSLYDLCSALIREYQFNSIADPYLNSFLDLVYKWQSNNKSSIQSFLTYWEQKEKSLSIQAESENAIRIMTIHKSKGLEFNVVIYPFANNNLKNHKSIEQWLRPEDLGFEPIPHIDKILYTYSSSQLGTAKIQQLHEEEIERIMLDNLNLLYVAFTRPKQQLFILANYSTGSKSISAIDTFLKGKEEHINPGLSTEDQHLVYQFGNPDCQKVPDKEDQVKAANSMHDSRACDWFDKIEIDPNPSMFWIHPDDPMSPVEWGTFIHQILSEIHTENDIDKALKPYLDEGRIDLVTADTIGKMFHEIAQNPLISKAFSPDALVKNECEILSKDHSIKRPDRFAEVDGTIYLLDYKTGQEKPEHHKQLREYADLLKEMTPRPILCYLVYINKSLTILQVN